MMIKICAILSLNHVLGDSNPEKNKIFLDKITNELELFYQLPSNNIVLIGAKAYDQFIASPMLKNSRKVLVVTNSLPDRHFIKASNVEFHKYVKHLVKKYQKSPELVFMMGGATRYRQVIRWVNELNIIRTNFSFEGNILFPDEWHQFVLTAKQKFPNYDFEVWTRKSHVIKKRSSPVSHSAPENATNV